MQPLPSGRCQTFPNVSTSHWIVLTKALVSNYWYFNVSNSLDFRDDSFLLLYCVHFCCSQFQILTLGYQNTTGSETIKAFWNILQSRELSFYPNEGDRILSILAEIEQYQFIIDPSDLHRSAEALTRIVNRILNEEYSILSPKVRTLEDYYYYYHYYHT